jgi:uncharacterized protein
MGFVVMDLNEKLGSLLYKLASLDNLAVAFSGGVDSSFLLKTAHGILGHRLLAVIISSPTFPGRELREAIDFVNDLKINYQVIEVDNLAIEGFADNPNNRCYLCKRDLFTHVCGVAEEKNINWVADGSNYDDVSDYRPGMAALRELDVISPLLDAQLSKEDIRELSKRMQLKTWDKPSAACLASRFAYGQKISREKLQRVEVAEDYLQELGFKQVRVRIHDEIARIEVAPDERLKFVNEQVMDGVNNRFKELGFAYTSLDLAGYRTGSMNETIGLEPGE